MIAGQGATAFVRHAASNPRRPGQRPGRILTLRNPGAKDLPVFTKSIIVDATVEAVFAFHEREDALQLLSPAFPPVRVVRKQGGIEPGSRVELRIGPVRWVALHTAFEKDRFFEDQQIEGPFALWIHRHEFEAVGDSTRLTDRIDFALPGGVWVNRLLGWAVRVGLGPMFRHRHQITRMFCERPSARSAPPPTINE